MTDSHVHFSLLANHLRDIHHSIQEQVRTKRKWEWIETPQGAMVAELMPLLSIIMLLERFAQPEATALPPFLDDPSATFPS